MLLQLLLLILLLTTNYYYYYYYYNCSHYFLLLLLYMFKFSSITPFNYPTTPRITLYGRGVARKPIERKLNEAILFVTFSVLLVFGAFTIAGDPGKLSDQVPVFRWITPSLSDRVHKHTLLCT